MLRSFLRDSTIYGGATVLTRGVSLFLVPIYTRILTPADYGVIDIVAVLAGVVASIVPLEIVQAIARFFPDRTDNRDKRAYASTGLWFAVGSYTLFLLIGLVLAGPLGRLFLGEGIDESLIRIGMVAIFGNGIFYVVQSQLRWSLQAREYAIAGVVYALVSIAASVVFVVGLRMGVSGVFLGQVVGALVGVAVSGRYAAPSLGLIFDVRKLHEMLRFSVPLVPSTLAVLLSLYVDRLAINALMTLTDVGLFGIGYRVASLCTLVLAGLQTAISPLVYATHEDETTPGELARIFRVFTAISIALWLALGLFAREIVALITTPQFYDGAMVVPLLVPAILLGGAYVFMPGLAIAKKTRQIAGINIGGAIMNVVLNFALIPVIGILGAAAATLISAAVTFSLNAIASQRTYPVPHNWLSLGAGVLLGGALVAIGWVLVPLTIPGEVIKLGMLVLGVGALLALGLIRVDEVRRMALRMALRMPGRA